LRQFTEDDESDDEDDEVNESIRDEREFLGDDREPIDYEDWDFQMDMEDLDAYMALAATAGKAKGVDAEHLSKIWRISYDDAKHTIEATSQNSIRTHDPTLSRNYGTNDRMLRYK